jgi:glutamate-5-semialdehyde dehydrogenase
VHAFRTIADLKDPIGEQVSRWIRPNGLEIVRVRVPIGVVGVAFESRPHVVANAAALCLKVGNALLLVGDNDARRTGEALVAAIHAGGERKGLPPDAVQAVFSDDPATYRDLARMQGLVDVLLPRGGRNFVDDIVDYASVPVLKHLGGACHVYVDASARVEMAAEIIRDGRCNEPYACNSADTVLIHRSIAATFVPALTASGFCRRVRLRVDDEARALLPQDAATAHDPDAELDLTLAIVRDVEEAIERVNRDGSHVADAIVAEDGDTSERFLREVDSACVLVNASPRFADGGEFGMGAEIGFSTDKLHARGPLGLEELTSTKYLVEGKGQVRG